MALDAHDLIALSALLDEAFELPPARFDAWLAALPDDRRHLAPRLREMQVALRATRGFDFLAAGPQVDPAPAEQVGDRVGPYRLLEPIGSGGMGVVWAAERVDGGLKRRVALKLPRLSWDSGLVERMARERAIGELLEHPHIARLYDAGVDDGGRPYLALEYVDGEPMDRWCDRHALGLAARLRLFVQVLGAVAYAHGRLVVHRDLKPSNVLVTADGQAHLLDFGIAKRLFDDGVDGGLTQDIGRMLTPHYASPEQVDGRPVTVASDVYSLGALLYELLTGVVPLGAGEHSGARALDAVLHAEPLRPSRVVPTVEQVRDRGDDSATRWATRLAGDVDTIVLKALRKQPADRYSSVERFAEDIERFLAMRPITARRPSVVRTMTLFGRRHRAAVAIASIGLVAVMASTTLWWVERARVATQAERTAAVRDFMLDLVEDVEPDEAHPGQDVTGKQMLQAGLARARDRFRSDPRTLGEVLGELFRMQRRLDADPDVAVLDEAAALLEANAPDRDAALNKVRVELAEAALARNEPADAERLARLALASCAGVDVECAKARAYADGVLGTLATRRGERSNAIELHRRAIGDLEKGFGTHHVETALGWLNLAIAERGAGDLEEAQRTVDTASAIAGRTSARAQDAADIARVRNGLLIDRGFFADARDALRASIAASGVKTDDATVLRLLTNANLGLGEVKEALASAEAALAALDAADRTPAMLFARQGRARAVALDGRGPAAIAEMRDVVEGFRNAKFAATSLESLRADRWLAELLLRNGDVDTADRLLQDLIARIEALPEVAAAELGQALDLRGCALQQTGRAVQAAALHARAEVELRRSLGPAHPWVERSKLYLARTQWLDRGAVDDRRRFEELAARYAARFPKDSIWRVSIDLALAEKDRTARSILVPMVL